MASTSAVYLMMRKRRAATIIEDHVEGVSVSSSDSDDETAVRLDGDDTRVATITGSASPADASSLSPRIRLEHVTDGETRASEKGDQIRRLLSRRAR